MGLFSTRDISWSDVYSGWTSGSSFTRGRDVKALRIVAVYGAVSLIADLFATLPQQRYRDAGGQHRKIGLPPWLVKPDPRMNAVTWRYQFVTSLKLRGNAYGLVIGSGASPLGVRWLHPDRVRIDESDPDGPRFWVEGRSEALTLYSQGGQIIHVPEFVQPGSIEGLSPIANFKQVYETAGYAMEYGRHWFEKSSVPAALLTTKTKLKPGAAAEARALFKEAAADGLVTLDHDWDYRTLSLRPDEAQFLDTIKASATLIATIFRVAPEDVGGETGRSLTYGNRQDDAERFNVRTMLPLTIRYELAMNELLPAGEFIKCNLDALVRPNLLDRIRANNEALKGGQLFHEEMRAQEDRAPATDEQVAFWKEHYLTTNTTSESQATSLALAIDEAVAKKLAEQITKGA